MLAKKILSPFFILLLFSSLTLLSRQEKEEPDTFYHYAISKMTAEQGLLRTLPQVQDLGWGEYFPDKEFLFHQWTALGYRLGGERGVVLVCQLLMVLILLMTFFLAKLYLPTRWALAAVLVGLFNFNFTFRLLLIRPHLMGIFLFLFILYGLLQSRKEALAVGAFLFPLAYHALYLPLLLFAVFFLCQKKATPKFILLWGFLPLLMGITLNPYFPSTLFMSWVHLKIALTLSTLPDLGKELRPLGFWPSFKIVGAYVVLCAFTLGRYQKLKKTPFLLPLFLLTTILTVLFFISPRSIEYLVPVGTVLFCALISVLPKTEKKFAPMAFILFLLVNLPHAWGYWHLKSYLRERREKVLAAVSLLPQTGKVFNCSWIEGAYILYERPKMKFVDLLDPNLLYARSPQKTRLRYLISSGQAPQTRKVLREVFGADYVLCSGESAMRAFDSDPHFVRLYPATGLAPFYLYKIN